MTEVDPESAVHKIRYWGASVICRFGMPDVSETYVNPKDPYLHECVWGKYVERDDITGLPCYTRFSLHAELIVLQALGLIEIVHVVYIYDDDDDIFRAFFRWTELGASEMLKSLRG